ncbi:MAG: UPF0262 family protein [Kiloniellales bacterium]|nr:UPF0262 family protein [Kiloniellales bacterium]
MNERQPAGEGAKGEEKSNDKERISAITLDERTVRSRSAEVEHERQVAIYDLLEENIFSPVGGDHQGPYNLHLSIEENRLIFDVRGEDNRPKVAIGLSLTPLRKIIRDYFAVCESYFEAIKTASPARIEAIDMGRRGLHNDGSTILRERLEGKIDVDFTTARRLFTLICVLHIRG